MANETSADLITLSGEIVASYASHNTVNPAELVDMIGRIHAALRQLKDGPVQAEPAPQIPAVPIRKSVTPDYIVCLEDGKKFKSMRRHLTTAFGLTAEQYRAKWGLPADYPMVAPNYAAARSALAKTSGLGQARKGKAKALPKAAGAAAKKAPPRASKRSRKS